MPHFQPKCFPLSEQELKSFFRNHDRNGDGLLSKKELKQAFKDLGAPISKWRAWRSLRHADANRDGYVSEDEMDHLIKYAVGFGYMVVAN